MAASPEPAARVGADWLLRAAWLLPGMWLGATVGFNLCFAQPGLNHDTAAGALFAGAWALFGALPGGLASGLVGYLVLSGLRRATGFGATLAAALTLLALAGACAVAKDPLITRLPALLWPSQPAKPAAAAPARVESTCEGPPPADPAVRRLWDQECG